MATDPPARARGPARTASRRGAALAGALALFALAVALRCLVWPHLFYEGVLAPPGAADEYYHLRRVQWSVEHFPHSIEFDGSVNHPRGAQVVWPPAWDLALAAVGRLAAGPDDPAGVERAVAAVPPLVGGLTVLGVLWLGRRHFGRLTGWVAAALLAVMPAHYLQSRAGKVDHHVAEALLAVWLYGAAMSLLGAARWRPRALAALSLGAAMAAMLLTWTGGLLHLLVVEAVAVGVVLADRERDAAAARALGLALAHALAALAVAPFCLGRSWQEWSAFSPLVLSDFQPLWLGAAALSFGALGLAFRWDALGASRARRVGFACAVGGAGIALAFAFLPGLADALDVSAGWFEKREDFQTHVLELMPLFWPYGKLRFDVAASLFTPWLAALPVAVAGLVWRGWQRRLGPQAWLLAAWASAFLVAAALQIRFHESLCVPAALCVGWLAQEVAGSQRLARRRFATAGVCALLAAVALPTLVAVYRLPVGDWFRPEPTRLGVEVQAPSAIPVGLWLRANAPSSPAIEDPARHGGDGMLANWSIGHLLRYVGRQAQVQDNFGVYGGREGYDLAERFYASEDEAEADRIAAELGVRWVLADSAGSGHGTRYGPRSMAQRLALFRGIAGQLPGGEGRPASEGELAALGGYRLAFESPLVLETGTSLGAPAREANALKLYERVAGARVEGVALPGAVVDATLPLEVVGQPFAWRARTRADADGRYRLRLPYATGANGPSVRALAPYTLRTARAAETLAVPEAAVLGGGQLAGPDLRGAD